MNMYDIIYKKRQGMALNADEIRFFIKGYTYGSIPDYQAAALLMAVYFQKLNDEETYLLTDAMRRSGDLIDLSAIQGIKVDKHSTGGVGDKTTLIVGPLAAACGVPIAKCQEEDWVLPAVPWIKWSRSPGFGLLFRKKNSLIW